MRIQTRQRSTNKLERQLCRASNDIRTQYCYNSKLFFGMSEEAREGLKRLAAKVALRLGFYWCHAKQGFFSNTREEAKRALKHAMRARRDRLERIVDRYAKGKVYAARMDSDGFDRTTMQEWDSLFR